jgi:hypothetical protein
VPQSLVDHYTDLERYKAIRASTSWRFSAVQPPAAEHPVAAYFTTLSPDTKNLAMRLRIPKRNLQYVFVFLEAGDLCSLRGDRGEWTCYSLDDYVVDAERLVYCGMAEDLRLAE